MGERCVIQIRDTMDDPNPARIYLHWGGEHAADVAKTLIRFADAMADNMDPRWTDAPYLAARFIAWAIDDVRSSPYANLHPLNFLSVGIVTEDTWGDALGVIVCGDTPRFFVSDRVDADISEMLGVQTGAIA